MCLIMKGTPTRSLEEIHIENSLRIIIIYVYQLEEYPSYIHHICHGVFSFFSQGVLNENSKNFATATNKLQLSNSLITVGGVS